MEVSGGYQLKTGDPAPPFALRGIHKGREKTFSLADVSGKKATVIAFWCNHCPYVQAYEGRFIAWASSQPDDVGIAAINSNDEANYPEDDWPHMVERAKAHGYTFPYLRDADQSVAKAYGAQCTPQFLVFDGSGHLAYQGRFDDNRDDPTAVKHTYLPDAVDALLRGERPKVDVSWAIGCSVKWG